MKLRNLRVLSAIALLVALLCLTAILMLDFPEPSQDALAPWEPPIIGRLSFEPIYSFSRRGPGYPELVFSPPSKDRLAIMAMGSNSVVFSTFSLPDGKEKVLYVYVPDRVLPGRNEVGLYDDNRESHDDGRLSVLRGLAGLDSFEISEKPILLPGGLTAGPLHYTRYTCNKWWVLYGEKEIHLINRASLKVIALPAHYGADSCIAISDTVAVLSKASRKPRDDFEPEDPFSTEESYFALLDSADPVWKSLPIQSAQGKVLPVLWTPLEGHLLVTTKPSSAFATTSLLFALSPNGEMTRRLNSRFLCWPVSFGAGSLLGIRMVILGNGESSNIPNRTRDEYYDFADGVKLVATGDDEWNALKPQQPGDDDLRIQKSHRSTIAAGLDKHIDEVDTPEGRHFEIIQGGVTRLLKCEGLEQCYDFYVDGDRLYAWQWKKPDPDKEPTEKLTCNLTILRIGVGFFSGFDSGAMRDVR